MDPKRIWAYYLRAAEVTGAPEGEESEGGTQTPFSVRSFFPDSPEGKNPLVRAYLGDEAAMDALPWAEGRALAQRLAPKLEEILPNPGLNPAQREAVLQALTAPVTLIPGPPGTGKTETICNLLACIHTLYPERTAAMVSGSNSAVDNVAEKLMKWAIRGGSREKDLLDAFSCFGSAARRKAWLASIGLEEAFRNRQYRPDRAYLDKRPLFTSTIHSLRRCFREADLQFDYVIVDESAQVSCLLGILAMGCAKRLVLLGDPLQLPAVITDRHAAVGREFPDLDPVFKDREGHSFLEACRARFPRAPFVLLNEHYRCHPLIAGFFNRYYGGALKLPPPAEGECPIHIRWYAGDYWETRGMKPVPRQGREFAGIDRQNGRILYRAKAGSETQLRAAYVNERQIAVFLREEWPELQRRLAAEPELTVCVLSPYVYQLHRLKQELERLGAFPALSEGDEEENTLPRLSIHEAQGREYDIVCYLPVEDNYPPEGIPRSQEQRTVNVALSRAVREFRIITAARWLPDGFPERPPEAGEDDRLQLSALIRYALEKGARPVRSGLRSIFDAIPRIRRERSSGRYCQQDILTVCAALIPVESKDPFWDQSARTYLSCLIAYVLECLPPREHTLEYVMALFREMKPDTKEEPSVFTRLLETLGAEDPESFAYQTYRSIAGQMTADKMFESIWAMISEKLLPCVFDGPCRMYAMDQRIDFKDLGRRRTAVFLTVSDMDRSMDRMVNLFYTQALQTLCASADKDYPTHCLPVPVRLYLDDFATNTFIPDFDKTVSVIRSREVSVSVILQSISQLEGLYGHAKAATIMNNCDNCLYLGGQDVDTARFIAVKANRTVDTILSLPLGEAWLFTRGRAPKRVRRFDLTAHGLYPALPEAGDGVQPAAG